MSANKSAWQTKELTDAFLDGVRGAIPGADLQLAVIRKIAELWFPEPTRVLDLGCGDGILGRLLLGIFPRANAVFADFSEPMLDAARAKLGDDPRARVARVDFSAPGWQEEVAPDPPFDIVVSGFAIHHRPDEEKKRVYSEIFEMLSPGGIFLNLEHVASQSPAGEKLFDEFFVDHLHRFHRASNPQKSRQEISETYFKRPDKNENILAPVDVQCQWLREIGFRDVDCFFKVFELALFGGRKSE